MVHQFRVWARKRPAGFALADVPAIAPAFGLAIVLAAALSCGWSEPAAAAAPRDGDLFPAPWIAEGGGAASLPEKPPVAPRPPWWRDVRGSYRVVWGREGNGEAARTWLRHELTAAWPRVGFTAYGQWERPGGPAGTGTAAAAGEGAAARLEWAAAGGWGEGHGGGGEAPLPSGEAGPALRAVLREAALRLGMRPLPSGDPFRLVYPESGTAWRQAVSARFEGRFVLGAELGAGWRAGRRAAATGARALPWQAAFQRARGSPRGDDTTWWQVAGETPGGGGRWRFTHAAGSRGGREGYRAWAGDGAVHWNWGEVRMGYARRSSVDGGPYRAAGFARFQTRRWGPWTAAVEWHRRDWGFRLPVGGDLPWKEGTTGWMWRLRRSGSPWEWMWEERVIVPLPEDPLRIGSTPPRSFERQPVYEVTWRPARTWWLRLRHEGSSLGNRARYEVQLRLTRLGVTLLSRYDALPERRWLLRGERTWGGQRVRLDWDQGLRAWRAEYRREWHPYRFRMVYKVRDDPSGAGGSDGGAGAPGRETFLFVEGGYRHPRGWGVSFTVGWDDRGRIDFHWRRPMRWEVAWDVAF